MTVLLGIMSVAAAGLSVFAFFACCLLAVIYIFGEPVAVSSARAWAMRGRGVLAAFGAWFFFKAVLFCVDLAQYLTNVS